MIGATARPASKTANGLRMPKRRAAGAGRPKMPLPIIELMTRAVRLQRPITRTRPLPLLEVTGEFVSQSSALGGTQLTFVSRCPSVFVFAATHDDFKPAILPVTFSPLLILYCVRLRSAMAIRRTSHTG